MAEKSTYGALGSLIDPSPIGMVIYNSLGDCVAANHAAAQAVGATKDQLLQQNYHHIEPWKKTGLYDLVLATLAEKTRNHLELPMSTTFGKACILDIHMVPITLEDQPHLLTMMEDITQRKHQEQELKQLYQDQKKRLQELHCLHAVTEAIRKETSFNAILEAAVQLIPQGWQYPESTRARIIFKEETFLSSAFEDKGWRLSSKIQAGSHSGIIEVFCTENPLEQGSFQKEEQILLDNIAHMLGQAAEKEMAVKEKALLEEQYRQAQKMEAVGRLAGGVAHDYNNSLSVIMGFAEMAMIEADPAGQLYADLNEILVAAGRASKVTRQLLAFARKQTISPRMMDLNENMDNMLKMLKRLMGEDIDLVWLPGENMGNIRMDPSQLDQILANLCVNARDAIAGVGKVVIETSFVELDKAYCKNHPGFVPGPFVLISVKDTGCGMDMEIRDHIFEPFFTTKDVDKGTGLGLATVYGIVKQNSGFINVDSEPGKGTSVNIYFPRHTGEKPWNLERENATLPPGAGEMILVVEDDEAILKLVTRILLELGYSVLSAPSPGQALELARNHKEKIHLLITDVIMPEMNGRELTDQLKILCPDLKSMFMSGYTANAIAHHGVLDKGVFFLQKPFSKKQLAGLVRNILDGAQTDSGIA